MERQREPVRAPHRRTTAAPAARAVQASLFLSSPSLLLPGIILPPVPVTWLSAATHEVSTCHTTALGDTELTATHRGAGGEGT